MAQFEFDRPLSYAPLTLAFIGDAVYSLFIRSKIIGGNHAKVHILHKRASQFEKAAAQCANFHKIEHLLTEEELAIYKKGRNTKSATVPKNANVVDYRHATGFEALLGYLYIKGESERLEFLMEKSFELEE